ncbi:MAG: glycosyltransferase, partial [Patescibacteria group bacterium]
EAQQYGVPVLGTRSGGIPEALEDGGSGFLVRERDVQGLAEKIELLARDKELCRKMGARGRAFVREKFDWRKSIKRHLILYTSAASNVKQ